LCAGAPDYEGDQQNSHGILVALLQRSSHFEEIVLRITNSPEIVRDLTCSQL
jgi:hypothetical protein